MTEEKIRSFEDLLDENQTVINAQRAQLPSQEQIVRTDIRAWFEDRDTAMMARNFVESEFRTDLETVIAIRRDRQKEHGYHCIIDLYAPASAEYITIAEHLMLQAAEKFGGQDVHWLIDVNI